jgi:SAM-dependent methyltransferase
MRIPWLRRNFLARRTLDRLILDAPDAVLRWATGRAHWPPYSLRSFVGGARDFEDLGRWFVRDLRSLNVLPRATRVLEIGCGCGRLAYPLTELDLYYTGMDIDRASIEWCQRRITPRHPSFRFIHADCFNASYNPGGAISPTAYRFPHDGESFDLIVLTSVLTHLVAEELAHYLAEVERLLAPDGIAYASLFLYSTPEDGPNERSRHGLAFPVDRGGYALNRADFPANAVAYQEAFALDLIRRAGLKLLGPARYGGQDLLLLVKQPSIAASLQLVEGWHDLEGDCWRWTKPAFTVNAALPSASSGPNGVTLRFRFTVPDPLLQEAGVVRLRAWINGVSLPVGDYTVRGENLYLEDVPAEALRGDGLRIEFEVEKPYGPTASDPRQLGVQVMFAAPCNQTRRSLCPLCVI